MQIQVVGFPSPIIIARIDLASIPSVLANPRPSSSTPTVAKQLRLCSQVYGATNTRWAWPQAPADLQPLPWRANGYRALPSEGEGERSTPFQRHPADCFMARSGQGACAHVRTAALHVLSGCVGRGLAPGLAPHSPPCPAGTAPGRARRQPGTGAHCRAACRGSPRPGPRGRARARRGTRKPAACAACCPATTARPTGRPPRTTPTATAPPPPSRPPPRPPASSPAPPPASTPPPSTPTGAPALPALPHRTPNCLDMVCLEDEERCLWCARYMQQLLRSARLDKLLGKHAELATEIRTLDSDMQMLVYENYNKFISATDTIRSMKVNVEGMDSNMHELKEVIGQRPWLYALAA